MKMKTQTATTKVMPIKKAERLTFFFFLMQPITALIPALSTAKELHQDISKLTKLVLQMQSYQLQELLDILSAPRRSKEEEMNSSLLTTRLRSLYNSENYPLTNTVGIVSKKLTTLTP